MRQPLHLLVILFFTTLCHGQKTDTLVLHYKSDQYHIDRADRLRLDSFISQNWDRILVNGYTDETESEEYNMELSRKRSGEVYQYFLSKNFAANSLASQYFGETQPRAENSSGNGRALNRRTEIIGYRYPRLAPKAPGVDLMEPVTKTLDNGLIITYRPGAIPGYLAAGFENGWGTGLQLITNTQEMRQYSLYNNTTRGEILSSYLIICPGDIGPCNLDSPVFVRIPVYLSTACPIEKVKFFRAVASYTGRIWKQDSVSILFDTVYGRKYAGVWLDNLCDCVNFDFKIDPDCFETDSTELQYVNADIRRISVELKGMNSVYIPAKTGDSTVRLLYIRDKLKDATITFSLYNGWRRIRGFANEPLSAFPYNASTRKYLLSTGSIRLYFPKLNAVDVVLKVNNDRYKVVPEDHRYDFTYLRRSTENILVDFMISDSRGRITQIQNQPIASIPFDEVNNQWVIDKQFLKQLKQARSIAGL